MSWHAVYVFLVVGWFVGFSAEAYGQPVEEIHIVRSIRVSRAEPTDFCLPSRTTFGGTQYEDRYAFATVRTRSNGSIVVDASGAQVGSVRACFGLTPDRAVGNLYFEGNLSGITFTAVGQCSMLKDDFPEPGIGIWECTLNLSGLAEPYVGGLLTSNTITSRKPIGKESDPPGYVQASIATIRLWKHRGTRSR